MTHVVVRSKKERPASNVAFGDIVLICRTTIAHSKVDKLHLRRYAQWSLPQPEKRVASIWCFATRLRRHVIAKTIACLAASRCLSSPYGTSAMPT